MNKKIFLTSMVALMIACPAYASLFNDPDASHQSGQIASNSTSEDCDSDPLQYQGQAVGYGTYTLTAQWEEDECPITLNSHTGVNEYGSTASVPTTLYARYADNVYLSAADRAASTNAMSTSANGLTTNPTGKTYTLTLNTNVTTAGTGGMNAAHTDSQVTAASGTKAASTTATMSFEGFFDATQLSKTQTNGTQYIDDDNTGKITQNGITAGTSISKVNNGSCPSTEWHAQYTCQDAATYTPQLTGYTFTGWYDAANNGNVVNDFCLDSDKTVYAHWTPKQYNIIYQPGDCAGSGTTISNALTYDVAPNHTVLSPSAAGVSIPTGYVFDYWSANVFGGDDHWDPADVYGSSAWQTDGNLVFTAACGPNIYTVTYDCNGGTIASPNIVESADATTARDTVVYDNLYTFVSQADLCTYQNQTPSGWSCTNATPWYTEQNWQIDNDVVCTAQWNATPYTITYDCGSLPNNGGTVNGGTFENGTDNVDTVYNGTTSYPVKQSASTCGTGTQLDGYHFAGWTCTPNLATGSSFATYSVDWPTSSTVSTTIDSIGLSGNATCEAQWAANDVKLIYLEEAGDATLYYTDTCVYGNSSFTLPSQPTKTGYTFTGWKVTNHQ